MISISENANPNYLARVVSLNKFEEHPNADSLKFAYVGMMKVLVSVEAKEGDIYVYFPVECEINKEFLHMTNSFSSQLLNADTTQKGFFGKNGRVKAVKLRGEVSNGYLVHYSVFSEVYGSNVGEVLSQFVDQDFDMLNGELMCKKYELPKKNPQNEPKGKKPKISRLVEGQVRLHVDTMNLRRESYVIKPDSRISVTYKTHGTSFWVGNVLVKKKTDWFEKIDSFLRGKQHQEYDIVYGSRKVVKNESETQNKQDYYGEDIWGIIAESLKDDIPKGYTLYGECLGYTPGGQQIQKGYDYGCKPGEHKIQIYRITNTNIDGKVIDLTHNQIKDFCENHDIPMVPEIYYGLAKDMYPEISLEDHWNEEFIKRLEADHNGKDCYLCGNSVPEEGIVVRVENLYNFNPFKLKSMRFLEYETKMLDEEAEDIESNN